jgi:serine/threonine protein phosphatase 1
MALLAKLPKGIPITISGDLIDRGPRSREVVQWCIDNNIDVTTGNHEDMMIEESDVWKMNGGYQALESYGCQVVQTGYGASTIYFPDDKMAEQFEAHKAYMKTLPTFIEYKDVVNAEGRYLVVSHSSINGVWKHRNDPTNKYFKENVIWGRPATIKDVPEIYNIFGHTPVENGPKIKVPFANVDTGACFHGHKGYGVLTALQYPEMIVYQQENVDV